MAIRKKVSEDTEDGIEILKPSSSPHNTTVVASPAPSPVPTLAEVKKAKVDSIAKGEYVTLQDTDIVVGRGAPTNYHIGNEYFRELVSEYRTTYFCSKRSDKPVIAMKVLDILKERGSRFVKRQKGGTLVGASWVVVSNKLAYEKVCAALREGTPEVQQRFISSSQKMIREAVAEQRGGGGVRTEKENGHN
ncbi:MAG: hypothetical protein SGARI_002167 [Bacillariaceae sp.]